MISWSKLGGADCNHNGSRDQGTAFKRPIKPYWPIGCIGACKCPHSSVADTSRWVDSDLGPQKLAHQCD
ncbi:hypothetical protein KC358_g40 [Hortaea werneckii]|nr:hypothetical protein KC358_g40 [Hortaea werneckii]